MKIPDFINRKKQGLSHSKEEIKDFISGIMDGSIADYQISAWLMAVCFQGLNADETTYLTEAMVQSGDILDLGEFGEFTVDKHSTGGVGDKVTLALIPLLAQAGLPVAKLSGRSLGHTGGTIDKLESIPNFDATLPIDKFLQQVREIGVAIAAQTLELAPADGKLYAMRDVTATVDSMGLIASSVVSKKIAAGANIIILDVKYGAGAFIKTKEEAEKLSELMKEVAKRLGRNLICAITSMEEPLGFAVGNSIEIQEAIDVLQNKGPEDVRNLVLQLGAIALIESKKADSKEKAVSILETLLQNGSAYKKFEELVKHQGGNLNEGLPKSRYEIEVVSEKSGYVKKLDALAIAKSAKLLGGGRDKKGDPIDHSVGIILRKKVQNKVKDGETIAIIHSNNENVEDIKKIILNAYTISDVFPEKEPLIYKIV